MMKERTLLLNVENELSSIEFYADKLWEAVQAVPEEAANSNTMF